MHIEPGVVDGAKIILSYATGIGAAGIGLKMAYDSTKRDGGYASVAARTLITSLMVFSFFQLLPHFPVGVSEVHFILGSTLLLMFGAGPAALGLALGLGAQGLLFAPADLPQYGMNLTTLIIPLYGMFFLSKRIIPAKTAYRDVTYAQAFKLSTAFQAGIVSWVAFWAFYGNGFSAESFAQVGSFGAAYMSVILLEPVLDIAVLAIVKNWPQAHQSKLLTARL